MKRFARFTLWLSIILTAALLLSACTRTVDRDVPEQLPTEEALATLPPGFEPTPTAAPAITPADMGGDGYPAPVEEPGTDPDVATDAPPAEDDADVPPAEGLPPAEGQPTPPETDIVYQVQAGDTLGKIADRYGVSINDIAVANNLSNIHSLDIGQTLIIPAAGSTAGGGAEQVHIVQPGETLFRIGLQYGLTVDELAAYNNLANPHAIDVGQEIRIPPSN